MTNQPPSPFRPDVAPSLFWWGEYIQITTSRKPALCGTNPLSVFFVAVCVFSRKWVRKGDSECQSRHNVLLPQAPRLRDWTCIRSPWMHTVIVGELRVSWRVTLALQIKRIHYSSTTTRHWSKATRHHLFHHLTISPWAAQVSLPSPSLHLPGNWSLPVAGAAVVLRLQSLWKCVGWALYTDRAKDRAIELQSLCLWGKKPQHLARTFLGIVYFALWISYLLQ